MSLCSLSIPTHCIKTFEKYVDAKKIYNYFCGVSVYNTHYLSAWDGGGGGGGGGGRVVVNKT